MGTNKDQTPESKNKANYEAAVLDFLDKEMAAFQPNKNQNESGQEVDALVTDLLKQVITESDEPNGESQAVSVSPEAILEENPPLEAPPAQKEDPLLKAPPIKKEEAPLEALPIKKEETPARAEKLKSPDEAAIDAVEDEWNDDQVEQLQEKSEGAMFEPRISGFAPRMAPRRKFPVVAVASVCILVIVGAAVFYLWGSSRKDADSREIQPDTSAPLALENTIMDAPAILQESDIVEPESSSSAGKNADSPQITPQPDRKAPSAGSSGFVPAAPVQKARAPKPKPVAPAATDQPADTTSDIESELPTVEFLTAQISAPSPLMTESNLNIDRSALPPMPDRIELANSALERNPVLTAQSQASDPAGSRNLVPSVLISQVSPVYPELAIRSRISGSVVLELQIDNEGKVVNATPVSGPSVFYNEAVKAAMQYRYRPATLDGKNVSSKSRVTMVFNLNR